MTIMHPKNQSMILKSDRLYYGYRKLQAKQDSFMGFCKSKNRLVMEVQKFTNSKETTFTVLSIFIGWHFA